MPWSDFQIVFIFGTGQRKENLSTVADTVKTAAKSQRHSINTTASYSSSPEAKSQSDGSSRISLETWDYAGLAPAKNRRLSDSGPNTSFRLTRNKAAIILTSVNLGLFIAIMIGVKVCLRRHRADVRRATTPKPREQSHASRITWTNIPQAYPGERVEVGQSWTFRCCCDTDHLDHVRDVTR